jgi:phosphatidylinositol kinase/protein kinase (PI-3  family)
MLSMYPRIVILLTLGIGASALPVPELIPFRLTPQMQAALAPWDESGLLRHYMILILQRLQSDASVSALCSTLGKMRRTHFECR